jgi:hypothetical protein
MKDSNEAAEIEQASDDILEGFQKLSDGVSGLVVFLVDWTKRHPVLKWLVLAPVSTVIGGFILFILEKFYSYFFGQNVPIGNDIEVETFPLPIGLTLWLLTTVIILQLLVISLKFVSIRKNIESIE